MSKPKLSAPSPDWTDKTTPAPQQDQQQQQQSSPIQIPGIHLPF
jgi:hypothetical protein